MVRASTRKRRRARKILPKIPCGTSPTWVQKNRMCRLTLRTLQKNATATGCASGRRPCLEPCSATLQCRSKRKAVFSRHFQFVQRAPMERGGGVADKDMKDVVATSAQQSGHVYLHGKWARCEEVAAPVPNDMFHGAGSESGEILKKPCSGWVELGVCGVASENLNCVSGKMKNRGRTVVFCEQRN